MQQQKRILSIKVKHLDDTDPDTSFLGQYSNNKAGDFSIDRAHKPDCASVSKEAEKISEQLERVKDYLFEHRDEIGNDSDNPYYWGLSEALDLVDEARESITECDCGKYLAPGKYRYFNPGSVEAFDAAASWIPTDETDKRAYWEKAMRQNALQDYARMESLQNGEWGFIGIRAQAEIAVCGVCQTITSGGLWGIESDSEEEVFREEAREQLAELRGILNELGFSKRAIAAAVKESK